MQKSSKNIRFPLHMTYERLYECDGFLNGANVRTTTVRTILASPLLALR